jgi:hypothetical protein
MTMPLCGGWSATETLTDKHNEIVQFAFEQLTQADCEHKHPTFQPKQIVDVVEMSQQVVSGMNYKFHLILADKELSEEEKKNDSVPKKKVKKLVPVILKIKLQLVKKRIMMTTTRKWMPHRQSQR